MKLPSTTLTLTPSAWYKADAMNPIAGDGSAVASWLDSSTEGHNLAQAASTSQPLYKTNILNGQPAVLFEGRDYLATTGALDTIFSEYGAGTVYAVAAPCAVEAATNQVIWSATVPGTSAASGLVIKESSSGGRVLHAYNNDGAVDDASVTLGSTAFGIFAREYNGGTYEYVWESAGGFDSSATGFAEVASGPTADTTGLLYVGAGTTGTYSSHYMAEMLFFRDNHGSSDRRHVHAYLANKYGLSYYAYSGSTDWEPVWVDVTGDVRAAPGLRFRYGINGAGPLDRVSSAGLASFALDNSPLCSGAVRGYYSPDHASRAWAGTWACRFGSRSPTTGPGTISGWGESRTSCPSWTAGAAWS